MNYILGISAYYHDSAACLISNGKVIAAAQEERFSRKKYDSSFPKESIKYCLHEAGITINDIEYIGFYDKPFLKFERLIETYLAESPKGIKSFMMAIPIWLKEKLFLKNTIIDNLVNIEKDLINKDLVESKKILKENITKKILFGEHHMSHASSTFFVSPFEESAIINMDGVGEWVTTSIMHGKNNGIKILKEINFPHSLGLLYSAFTYYTGFKVNSGEYKLMGLAPYGEPIYVDLIKDNLIDIKEDGSYKLNMKYFNYTTGLSMTNSKFNKLFGEKPRKSESKIDQFHMDIAASIQKVTEEIVIKICKTAKKITNSKNLCLSGGVALNCVANGKIIQEKIFENVFIQPASGDAGGSIGVAFLIYYQYLSNKRSIDKSKKDSINGSYLGPKYSNDDVEKYLKSKKIKYIYKKNIDDLCAMVADEIENGKVVGWHQGRMEFGPRALGSRSILGDPRCHDMQRKMNLKIKFRESFRPFAPAILREDISKYFDIKDIDSPYMLIVAKISKEMRVDDESTSKIYYGLDKLDKKNSKFPAITHVDYSARIQTVDENTNLKFYKLLKKFKNNTGCPILINTSFNVRSEPIVCSPEDSYRCFMRTEMDILVIEDFILYKKDQPNFENDSNWKDEYEID